MRNAIARTASVFNGGSADRVVAHAGPRGPTIDFAGVNFLARGRIAANTVCHIPYCNCRY
jgi:hypothetical protein